MGAARVWVMGLMRGTEMGKWGSKGGEGSSGRIGRGVNQGLRCLGSPLGQNQMPLRPPSSPD